MLTLMTQTAIAALYDIASGGTTTRLAHYPSYPACASVLFDKLEVGGLISRIPDTVPGLPGSYRLTRDLSDISLLQVLEATGEHLNCNCPASEEMYIRSGPAAHRLGVVNYMTRLYLSEIKLNEL